MLSKFFGLFKRNNEPSFEELFQNHVNISLLENQVVIKEGDQMIEDRVIEDYEHDADKIVRQIFEKLDVAFITHIDKTDIIALIRALDDVIDSIKRSAVAIATYRFQTTQNTVELSFIIKDCVEELRHAISKLSKKDTQSVSEHLTRIESLEDKADFFVEQSQANIADAKHLDSLKKAIAAREIIGEMESATDACQHAINIISDIVRKEA